MLVSKLFQDIYAVAYFTSECPRVLRVVLCLIFFGPLKQLVTSAKKHLHWAWKVTNIGHGQ